MSTPAQRVLHVGVVLYPKCLPLDPTNILQNLTVEGFARFNINSPIAVKITYLAHTLEPLTLASGFIAVANHTFEDIQSNEPEGLDAILLPGGAGSRIGEQNLEAQEFVKWAVPKASYVMTVCTGSLLLAYTGLLRGHNATTNKLAFREVEEINKDKGVTWIKKARWVESGKFWTSSGVSAGMDMICGWIETVMGKEAKELGMRLAEYIANGREDDPWAAYYGLA